MVRDIVKSWVSSIASNWSNKFSEETLDTYKFIFADRLKKAKGYAAKRAGATPEETVKTIKSLTKK